MTWAVLIFATAALGVVASFGWAALAARLGEGKQNARATELAVRLEVETANKKTEAARADKAEGAVHGLEALLDEIATHDDPSIARAHVLSRRQRRAGEAPANDRDPGPVSRRGPDSVVAGGSDDALLKPGE